MRRPRYTGEAAVYEAVYRLMNKFEYPDELGGGGPVVPSGGGGAPTVVVAASDSSDLSKSKADYVCPGVNDQDVIQAAIDITDVEGGEVWLTEGTYTTSGEITLSNQTALRGLGVAASEIIGSSSTALVVAAGRTRISDLYIENTDLTSGNAVNVTGSLCVIERCNLWSRTVGNAIQKTGGDSLLVHGCWIQGDGDGIVTDAGDGDYLVVTDSLFQSCEKAIHVTTGGVGSARIVIADNIFEFNNDWAIQIEESQLVQIVGNSFLANGLDQNGTISLDSDTSEAIIVGNTFNATANGPDVYTAADQTVIADNSMSGAVGDAVHIDGAALCVVSANQIFNPENHGIRLSDSSNCQIANNLINQPGQATDNTYDGIILSGNSDLNSISGNKIIGTASAPQPRYAVNISAATCDNNAVVGNNFSDPGGTDYGTARFNDAGTGTITLWSSGGPNGDNIN